MEPKDCCNLAKEFNGEKNWCLLRDAHCPLLAKHERYNFDKDDIKCDYLNMLNGIDSKYGIAKEVALSSKECKGCKQIFKTDNLRLRYCSDTCRKSARRTTERNSRTRNSLAK
jgi:hypothetical protein